MNQTTNVKLPYIMPALTQEHVTHNEALRVLDAIVQLSVLDRDLAAPPVSPSDGDRYIVAASSTGVWAGRTNDIAAWQEGSWSFYSPAIGWQAWIADEASLVAWNGITWIPTSGGVWIDVTASPYGAVGDGTADDLEAIQAALNAANAAGGGVVYVPAGVFKVSNTLQLYSNVELRGAGPGSVIRNPAGALEGKVIAGVWAFASIALAGVTGAAVRNLTLDHVTNATTSNGIVIGGHGASVRSSKCVVEGVTVLGHPSHQYLIWIANADNNRIVGNSCIGGPSIPATDTAGIEIHGGVGNMIRDNHCSFCNPGIALVQENVVEDGDLIDNAVIGNRVNSCGSGIVLVTVNGRSTINTLISGNLVSGCTTRGINVGLSAMGVVRGMLVTDNVMDNNSVHIAFDANGAFVTASRSMSISGNLMTGGAAGILLNGTPNVSVRGNAITAPSGVGMSVNAVTGAFVSDNAIVAPIASAIEVYTSSGLRFTDNTLLSLPGIALQFANSGSSDCEFSRNFVERAAGNSANVILGSTTTSVLARDNRIKNPPTTLYNLGSGGETDSTVNFLVSASSLNDVSFPGEFVRMNSVPTTCELSGISGGYDGRIMRIYNNSSGRTITLRANNSASQAVNRLSLGPVSSVALNNFATASFRYSGIDMRWVLISVG